MHGDSQSCSALCVSAVSQVYCPRAEIKRQRGGPQVGGNQFEDSHTDKRSAAPNFAPFRQKSLGDCTRPLLPTQGWLTGLTKNGRVPKGTCCPPPIADCPFIHSKYLTWNPWYLYSNKLGFSTLTKASILPFSSNESRDIVPFPLALRPSLRARSYLTSYGH